MSNGFSFPSELIYIGIGIVMVVIIVVQAMTNANQKHELEYLRSRRNLKKPEQKQQAKDACPKTCDVFCNYRDLVVPTLEAEVEGWKEEYRNAELRYAFAQNTIAKLRAGGESRNVQGN